MNDRGIWTTKEEVSTHHFDRPLCDAIITECREFKVKTIADIGCGDGSYTKYLNDNGFQCAGFDGSPMTPFFCTITDFSEPVCIGKYDLLLSLEVGEHIPQEFEQVFLDNLCNAPILILSWAIPGQGGTGHVNCRDNSYIIQQMEQRGYGLDNLNTSYLIFQSTLSWFKNTLMVFQWSK